MTHEQQTERVLQFNQIEPGMAAKPIHAKVTREMIAKYCRSIQEEDPVFLDDAAARKAGLPGIVAPASMCLVYAPQRRLEIMHERGFISPEEVADHPRNTPFVGIEMTWHGVHVRPGDTVTSACRFSRKWEARSGNRFVSIGVTAHNGRGELVVDYQYNIIWELAKGQKPRSAEARAAAPVQAQPQQPGGRVVTPALTFDMVQPGDLLPSASRHVTQALINDYASLNDWEGKGLTPTQLQHVDEAFASKTLFGGTTLHGPAAVGHMIAVFTYAFGPNSLVNGGTFTDRALEPVRPGDTVVYTGRVLAKRVEQGGRVVEAEVQGTNQLGQTTATAKAVLRLD